MSEQASLVPSDGGWNWPEIPVHKLTMAVTLLVFLFEGCAYNLMFLRRVLPVMGKGAFVWPFFAGFNLIWGLALWSYAQAHLSDPGVVTKRWYEFVNAVGNGLPVAPPRFEWQPGKATFCKKCILPRPERAHHCHICQVCVLRMDHHCPWINNCVGQMNHKFFVLLIIYGCLASYVALATSLPELIYCVEALVLLYDPRGDHRAKLQPPEVFAMLTFALLALFLAGLLTPMITTHLPFAARNVTSIESNYKNMPNPYDRGSTFANVAQVFGAGGLDWVIPIQPRRPLCDGISFARTDEHLMSGQSDPSSMLGDSPDAEELWRKRYHVNLFAPLQKDEQGPWSTFARWLHGGGDNDSDEDQGSILTSCHAPGPAPQSHGAC